MLGDIELHGNRESAFVAAKDLWGNYQPTHSTAVTGGMILTQTPSGPCDEDRIHVQLIRIFHVPVGVEPTYPSQKDGPGRADSGQGVRKPAIRGSLGDVELTHRRRRSGIRSSRRVWATPDVFVRLLRRRYQLVGRPAIVPASAARSTSLAPLP